MSSSPGKNRIYLLCLALALLFYLFIAFQIPYTHDDWGWGSAVGIHHLVSADINSRYVGNLLEVLLTRSPLLKSLVMGLSLTAIPVLAVECALRLAGRSKEDGASALRPLLFMAANVLLLLMRDTVWAQTCGWVAGFSNFVFSALLFLIYLPLLADLTVHPTPERGGIRLCLFCFLFSVLLQLFIENLSVAICFFTLCACVQRMVSKQRVGLPLMLLLGSLLGAALMFSSGIYRTLWETGSAVGSYRQLTISRETGFFGNVPGMLHRFCGEIVPQMLSWNGQFAAAAAVLLFLHALCFLHSRGKSFPILLFALGDCLYSAYYLYAYYLTRHLEADVTHLPQSRLFSILDCLFLLFVLLELAVLFRSQALIRRRLVMLWLVPLFILAPMLLINTVGPRSFYTSNVCYLLFCLSLSAALPLLDAVPPRRATAALCAVCMLGLMLFWTWIYASIGRVSRLRDAALAKAAAGTEIVSLPAYPHKHLLWCPNPVNEDFLADFRAFYRIPDETELVFE